MCEHGHIYMGTYVYRSICPHICGGGCMYMCACLWRQSLTLGDLFDSHLYFRSKLSHGIGSTQVQLI